LAKSRETALPETGNLTIPGDDNATRDYIPHAKLVYNPSMSGLSLRSAWYSFFGAILLAAAIFGGIWFYVHRNDGDIRMVAIHVLSDLVPFLAALAIALWAEHVTKFSHTTRVVILLGGLAWSGVWGWRDLADIKASKADIQGVIATAVSGANTHSDQQIGAVRNDLQKATANLQDKLDSLSTQVTKSDTDVVGAISKVGTAPTKYAQLQFSLWGTDASKFPITTETLSPEENGEFSVDFTATNVTDTSATGGDLWVIICDDCVFTKEPQGFDKPTGSAESMRHKKFGDLNPGVSIEKMTVEFKTTQKFASVFIGFRYSCATCGKIETVQKINILTSYPTLQLPPIVLPKLN
jgi:hypothetical protein